METERHAEMTSRLSALVDLLSDDSGLTPPPEAAATWSEAAIRRWFLTQEVPATAVVDGSQPGGGVVQRVPEGPPPTALVSGQDALPVDAYRAAAFARGIPPRPHGLFPPACPVLGRIAADASFAPFEKLLVDATGRLSPTLISWPVGDDAASRGIDLRYFAQKANAKGASTLLAAVRYGARAGIGGDGFHTGAHGGAIESAFDEVRRNAFRLFFHR